MLQNTKCAIAPTDGFPSTRILKDEDGNITGYAIVARHLTPLRARIIDKVSLLIAAAALYGFFKFVPLHELKWYIVFASITAMPVLVCWTSRLGMYWLFRRTNYLRFEADTFRKSGLFRQKIYDRNVSHSFAIFSHPKADFEDKICEAIEAILPRILTLKPLKRYHSQSRYIAFEYMGQRQDLMFVYKHRTAAKILARLNVCDQLMDGIHGNGRGEVLKPEAEWSELGGSLSSADI